MGVPFDNSHYVGQTSSPPCTAATPWVVVFGGSYSGCYSTQQEAEDQYNALSGSTGSGATATSPTAGNTAPPSPTIPVGASATSGAVSDQLFTGDLLIGGTSVPKWYLWVVGGGLAAVLVLRKR